QLGLYQDAVNSMLVYVSNVTHFGAAFTILGSAYFHLKEYQRSYSAYSWVISLAGPNNVRSDMQRSFLCSLYHLYTSSNEFAQPYHRLTVIDGLKIFDSLNKKDLYQNVSEGIDAFYW